MIGAKRKAQKDCTYLNKEGTGGDVDELLVVGLHVSCEYVS